MLLIHQRLLQKMANAASGYCKLQFPYKQSTFMYIVGVRFFEMATRRLNCSKALFKSLHEHWRLPSCTIDHLYTRRPLSMLFKDPPSSQSPRHIGTVLGWELAEPGGSLSTQASSAHPSTNNVFGSTINQHELLTLSLLPSASAKISSKTGCDKLQERSPIQRC